MKPVLSYLSGNIRPPGRKTMLIKNNCSLAHILLPTNGRETVQVAVRTRHINTLVRTMLKRDVTVLQNSFQIDIC